MKCVFREKIGRIGNDDTDQCYIKIKEIEQNASSNVFALVYYDNGLFKLRTFEHTYNPPDKE